MELVLIPVENCFGNEITMSFYLEILSYRENRYENQRGNQMVFPVCFV